jgi:hypothetical protein
MAEGTSVARFYFDVRVGSRLRPDMDGLWLDGIEAAERYAARAAAGLAVERMKPCDGKVAIEVRDEAGRTVSTARVSVQLIRRTKP